MFMYSCLCVHVCLSHWLDTPSQTVKSWIQVVITVPKLTHGNLFRKIYLLNEGGGIVHVHYGLRRVSQCRHRIFCGNVYPDLTLIVKITLNCRRTTKFAFHFPLTVDHKKIPSFPSWPSSRLTAQWRGTSHGNGLGMFINFTAFCHKTRSIIIHTYVYILY